LIFLGVTLYIDLFQYFIGKEFRTGLHVVPVILLANVFLGIFYNLSVWYKLNDLTRYGAIMALIGATVTIVFNIILIPLFGYVGSAWAHFSCYFSMMVISFFWGRKYYPINYELRPILGYIFLAVILFFVGNNIGIDRLTPRLIVNTLLILVFIMVVFVFERRKLKKVIG
jgi:O-antigen/teichoic acid export membrane protein